MVHGQVEPFPSPGPPADVDLDIHVWLFPQPHFAPGHTHHIAKPVCMPSRRSLALLTLVLVSLALVGVYSASLSVAPQLPPRCEQACAARADAYISPSGAARPRSCREPSARRNHSTQRPSVLSSSASARPLPHPSSPSPEPNSSFRADRLPRPRPVEPLLLSSRRKQRPADLSPT